jgi:hypothetical protein
MRISDTPGLRKSFSTRRAIYDGRERLGDFEKRGTEFVARDRRGQTIGLFDTAIDAINAVAKVAP